MADLDASEYDRPPVYSRPPQASMVKLLERVAQGRTQKDAVKEN